MKTIKRKKLQTSIAMQQNGGCLRVIKSQENLKQDCYLVEYQQVVCDSVMTYAQCIAAKAFVRRSWGKEFIRINSDILLGFFPANNIGYCYILAAMDYLANGQKSLPNWEARRVVIHT